MSFLAVGVAGGVAVAGAVASSAIQAGAAKKAAETQAKSADEALNLQWEQYQQQREDLAPWRESGGRALGQLERLARQGPPEMDPWRAPRALDPRRFAFKPPSAAEMMRDPGYQFRLQEGQKALERSAAARGGLLSGGFARGLERYAQDYGSQEYGNVYQRKFGENQLGYGRALAQNQSAYDRALQQYQTRYNVGSQQWQNRLAPWKSLAGLGGGATEMTAKLGGQYAANAADLLTGQGAALAGGQMGAANAWSQGLGSLSNTVGQGLGLYRGMQQPQYPGTPPYAYNPNTAPYDSRPFMGR